MNQSPLLVHHFLYLTVTQRGIVLYLGYLRFRKCMHFLMVVQPGTVEQ